MNYLSRQGYVLYKENIQDLDKLKSELIGKPLQDEKYYTAQKNFPLYIESSKKIIVPKMYGITKFGKPERQSKDYSGKDFEKPIQFTGILRPHQVEPINVLYNELKNESSGGILSLSTGLGKTFCMLDIISRLNKKTLIIVNKISLLHQWISEIKLYLPNASVGIIQGQKTIETEGKDIVVSMLQSLSKIDYPDCIFQDFGVTVTDECHNICSRVFVKALMKVSCKYTIGLSATPTRSDGCEYIFKWFLGDIAFKSTAERKGLIPILHTIKLDSIDYKEVLTLNRATGLNQIQFTSMISDLINMEKRNKIIFGILKELVLQGRKILVLSDRREHLKKFIKLFEEEKVEFTYGLFVGQMKLEALEKSKKCQVILATYQAFGEGVNEPDLDTLVMITPKKFVGHLKGTVKNESGKLEQIVGRIFRKEHTVRPPLIVDFQDNFSVYKSQFKQRMVFYKSHFKNLCKKHQDIDMDTGITTEKKNINTKVSEIEFIECVL
jgi:superfamily II DNA or RNA helicase